MFLYLNLEGNQIIFVLKIYIFSPTYNPHLHILNQIYISTKTNLFTF